MLTGKRVTVGTTATLLHSAVGSQEVRVRAPSGNQFFIGGSAVSVSDGYVVNPGISANGDDDAVTLRLNDDDLYAVSTGSTDVFVLAYTV